MREYEIVDGMEYGNNIVEDSRDLIPDVCRETRYAAVDIIRGAEPTTVLGLIMSRDEPLTLGAIAGLLCRSIEEVEWTVEMLEQEDLAIRVSRNGLTKVRAFAAFSARNGGSRHRTA